MTQSRISFYTLGCRLNHAETAQIAQKFRRDGYAIVAHGDATDVAVIHTCSVTERADQRCRQEIRKIHRSSPDALVCAVGCYAQSEPETVRKILGVDLVVGNDRKYGLSRLVSEYQQAAEPEVHVSNRLDFAEINVPEEGDYNETRANLKIQDGCDFHCAFCLLPRIRGGPRSRPFREILDAGMRLVEKGHREIVVTGVNIGLYRDGSSTLADVARSLSDLPGLDRLRISSIEPSTISEDLLQWMETHPRACQHLHVPLQSGSDSILSDMRRLYTVSDYTRFIEHAKERMPGLGLGTDVIVGFPGETDEDFEKTQEALLGLPFTYLHVFSYSDRLKTPALGFSEKVHSKVIKSRSLSLRELSSRMRRVALEEAQGENHEVLFETVDDGGLRKGWTRSYLQVGVPASEVEENELAVVQLSSTGNGLAHGRVMSKKPRTPGPCAEPV